VGQVSGTSQRASGLPSHTGLIKVEFLTGYESVENGHRFPIKRKSGENHAPFGEPLLDKIAVEFDEPRRREYSWFPIRDPVDLVQFKQMVKYVRCLVYTYKLELGSGSLSLPQEPTGLLASIRGQSAEVGFEPAREVRNGTEPS
jgi:hypothetical protein